MLVDELREILVAGRNHDLDALRRRLPGERADDVVGLDARLHDQRPAERGNAFMQRRDLARQILRHRRPIGLVFRIPLVAEGFALGVEDAGLVRDARCLVVAFQPA